MLTSAAVRRGGRGCPRLDAAFLLAQNIQRYGLLLLSWVCVWDSGSFYQAGGKSLLFSASFAPRGPDSALAIPDAFFLTRSCGREELQRSKKKGVQDEKQIAGLFFLVLLLENMHLHLLQTVDFG